MNSDGFHLSYAQVADFLFDLLESDKLSLNS